jgi:molybdate transport repressor ModE-like protein
MLKNSVSPAQLSPYAARAQLPVAKHIPDWDDFRILMTVIKMGSFNRAADALGLSQPTVSRRIAALEEAIGKRIVDRGSTGAVLTLEGQRICDELSIAHAALERAIEERPRSHKDVVKLLITDGVAAYWLTHFLPSLYRHLPQIELRIFTSNDSLSERGGHHDLSLHFLSPNDPDMVANRLGMLHFIPYASASYLREHGHPLSPADFANHRLLDFMLYLVDNGSWMTILPNRIGQECTQLFTNSSAVLAESVRNGAGIALLPTYGSLFEKGMVPLDIGLYLETPFWLCYRQEAIVKSAVQCVSHFLRHIFDRNTMPWFADRYVSPAKFPKTSVDAIMASFSVAPIPAEDSGGTVRDAPTMLATR